MLDKHENLNINDLDVQELENRIEMSMMMVSSAGWIRTEPDPYPNPPKPVEPPCPYLDPSCDPNS